MRTREHRAIQLKDYRPPAFLVDSVELRFELYENGARVHSRLALRRNPEGPLEPDLVLDGEELELRSVRMDDVLLAKDDYVVGDGKLRIPGAPLSCTLDIETWILPQNNTRLEGLYKSSGMFCTQCEAEGFRRITFYPDRPDVMTRFRTRIEADFSRYPVLLSNGNPVESGTLDGGRHFVTWEDPFPKPCYLFALVAGDLSLQRDQFITQSGRVIDLRMYVEHRNAQKCAHALDSLKRSMRWDEEVYGREYDLDIFMIVAVDDFNMGAMENKGLNIFNSSCVLASPETATDAAYQRIEAIVAHEYFHNWSGNRVTCRDWFQLSLKEGFTVFRDAQFSADMHSPTVKRIDDVNLLRTAQFAEDAGPMAHPVRPASYIEISNFYTLTVYEKGAEVVRMLHTLLGAEQFRRGSDLYFERHDGQAVTTDDFVAAMEAVSGRDLTQFKGWYDQAGTPVLTVRDHYDAKTQCYTLRLEQQCPATPGQSEKQPFVIPVSLALFSSEGRALPLQRAGDAPASAAHIERAYEMTESVETWVFEGVPERPVPSLLRGFSAPVRLNYPWTRQQLMFLMRHDTDGFNRWDAGQQLAIQAIHEAQDALASGDSWQPDAALIDTYRHLLEDPDADLALVARMLQLPSESWLIDLADPADPLRIHGARERVLRTLAEALGDTLMACYDRHYLPDMPYDLKAAAMARRALCNTVLTWLMAVDHPQGLARAVRQYQGATNLTERAGALRALSLTSNVTERQAALDDFYNRFQHDPQVIEQWFSIQASSPRCGALGQIRQLIAHPAFDWRNPNKVRAVVGTFANQNLVHFHAIDGAGYAFLADCIQDLDARNPQVAARLATPLTRWKKYDGERREQMQRALARIQARPGLSPDVYEVVSKSLLA